MSMPSYYTNDTTISFPCTCTSDILNRKGTMHGGNITKFLDEACGQCGLKYTNSYVSTACIHFVTMTHPIFPGDELEAVATIVRTGKTSMFMQSYLVRHEKEEDTIVAHAGLTVVKVKDHKPQPVPALPINSVEAERQKQKAEKILSLSRELLAE